MEPLTPRCAGALVQPDGSVCWRVWAPGAEHVDLVLIDGATRRSCRMARDSEGYFHHTEAESAEGQRYAYRLDDGPERPDPASLWQPEGVHRPSAVCRPEHLRWTDQSWRGVRRADLVLYELHVGTFTPLGTFDAVIPRLERLRQLGVTAIELMPVAQFPGNRNWGYDGVYLYAPQNSYGGPHGLQRLVDACHAQGLAVFLDVVYNHLGPEGNYLADFGPYFTDRYRTAWGPAFNYDGAGCDAVRDFILDNARLWLEEYHLDGLRLDAVHAIYDFSPRHILQAIQDVADQAARRTGRLLHVIAESNLNDVRLLVPPERGGYGLGAQWSDDFHHAIHTSLTGERGGYYADFGPVEDLPKVLQEPFLYQGRYSRYRGRRHGAPVGDLSGDRFVVMLQNHDQVGNRARGDRLDTLVPPPARRLAASLLLLAPYMPLLFMGEEYGEDHPFPFFCSFEDPQLIANVRAGRRREFAAFAWQGEVPDPQAEATFRAAVLTWSWEQKLRQSGLRQLYGDLLAARRKWPALQNYSERSARLLPEGQAAVLELIRGGRRVAPEKTLQIFFNLTEQRQPLAEQTAGTQVVLFSSEVRRYAGQRSDKDDLSELLPHECMVMGSASWRSFI
jgi:maltooligosyltrehalose trehalohydrolase